MTFADLLEVLAELNEERDNLFAEGLRPTWYAEARCAIVDIDPYDDSDPEEVVVAGTVVGYVLPSPDLVDIARELREVRPDPTAADFVEAIQHYHEYDGFLPA